MLKIDQMESSDLEDRAALIELAAEARSYVEAQPWCERVDEVRFADGFERVGVFRVLLTPQADGEAEVWVVTGDLPPMHIPTNGGAVTTPAEALFLYAGRLIAWLNAAKDNDFGPNTPVLRRRWGLKPLEVTPEHMDLVDRRINLLFGSVIPWILGDTDVP